MERIRPRLPRLRERVSFTGWLAKIRDTAPEPLPRVDPGAAAQIQYTSGTTGTPKGAVLHHRGLDNAAFVAARAGFTRNGVWGSALPLFHTAGCDLTVLGAATATGTLVLVQVFQPTLVLEALQQWRVTFFAGVPAKLSALLNHPSFGAYDLSACSAVLSGGDRVPPDLLEETEPRFGARFSTLYGQTELSPAVTQTSPDNSIQDKLNIAGRPLWQVEVKIVGPADADPLRVGEPGEICARGYQVVLGYYDLPEATAQTVDRDGWLHTGDLGVMDERGYVTVTGRLKDMIIRGGENTRPPPPNSTTTCVPSWPRTRHRATGIWPTPSRPTPWERFRSSCCAGRSATAACSRLPERPDRTVVGVHRLGRAVREAAGTVATSRRQDNGRRACGLPSMGSRMPAGRRRGCGDERRLCPRLSPTGYAALPWASVATSAHSSQVFRRSA
ncbi:class I adenylate-forming enzyme family protein [Streptomyces sp. ME18-1-4]|uniref:class I adenylate-forming enzyme family protein n=1 Tax=Streptomyces sp. ME18-1-4 TaxID=3028685 RepID=UPI0029AF91ED|nr:AMP-binding protein [Streptomyces sp. ME18-1-4]MDX3242048.1 AMP-binding protein [Streptomyces sp. ME18-1-4]